LSLQFGNGLLNLGIKNYRRRQSDRPSSCLDAQGYQIIIAAEAAPEDLEESRFAKAILNTNI